MFSLPWWIYLVVAGIIFSGYMTVKTAAREREIDEAFIEKEGEIYMERIRQERERRKQAKSLQ
ncbi:sporulation YhaL family protein [Geobacillus sp. FSL K6-0789]|nr:MULTISPECIES: sporulation YhaL family protein [Geobacillus]AKM17927.1 Sporulation protein YhaL [Geobacillus sp. 12AMOR1]AKU27247.1 SigE-dependent sporulation protein [Geobacillus sp. LC300]ASS87932.1 SigE-dependent sporulation protein [Geobacillus lituanicus]MED0653395.1 sporulation YhaL family protein [Anoxybacillus geothermalis]STO36395.1 Sporulation protein yhaL [[Flavobacterium] thermophilum]